MNFNLTYALTLAFYKIQQRITIFRSMMLHYLNRPFSEPDFISVGKAHSQDLSFRPHPPQTTMLNIVCGRDNKLSTTSDPPEPGKSKHQFSHHALSDKNKKGFAAFRLSGCQVEFLRDFLNRAGADCHSSTHDSIQSKYMVRAKKCSKHRGPFRPNTEPTQTT